MAKHKSHEKHLEDKELAELLAKTDVMEKYQKAEPGDPEKNKLLADFAEGNKTKKWLRSSGSLLLQGHI